MSKGKEGPDIKTEECSQWQEEIINNILQGSKAKP
jgi:hypothetical protein